MLADILTLAHISTDSNQCLNIHQQIRPTVRDDQFNPPDGAGDDLIGVEEDADPGIGVGLVFDPQIIALIVDVNLDGFKP